MPTEEERRRIFEWLMAHLARQTLPEPPPFPEPDAAEDAECVALGARLTPEMVLTAYRRGIFPMAEPGGAFGWWCPDPRTVLDLADVHVPRRLQRTVRQGRFEVRVDTACPDVIAACADRAETWISPEIEEVYGELYRRGVVHSVETWSGEHLVGGLYGVAIGGAFMAESMFHREREASKVAVVALVERLRARGYVLCDIQYETQATSVFRPKKLPRREYLARLRKALTLERSFVDAPGPGVGPAP